MLLELEIPLGLLVVLVGTVVVTFGASADAFWGGEAGILSVLSVLEGSLDLLVEEVVEGLGWRRDFLSNSSFLAVSKRECSRSFCRACILEFRSVMVSSWLDVMDLWITSSSFTSLRD